MEHSIRNRQYGLGYIFLGLKRDIRRETVVKAFEMNEVIQKIFNVRS